jgi:hypothetical protein
MNQGLRSSDSHTTDLVMALSRVQQELAIQADIDFHAIVAGKQKPLERQSNVRYTELAEKPWSTPSVIPGPSAAVFELEYADTNLGMRVRDDGRGIDPRSARGRARGTPGTKRNAGAANENRGQLEISSSAAAGD